MKNEERWEERGKKFVTKAFKENEINSSFQSYRTHTHTLLYARYNISRNIEFKFLLFPIQQHNNIIKLSL